MGLVIYDCDCSCIVANTTHVHDLKELMNQCRRTTEIREIVWKILIMLREYVNGFEPLCKRFSVQLYSWGQSRQLQAQVRNK